LTEKLDRARGQAAGVDAVVACERVDIEAVPGRRR
jgi:hypothetical protein